MLTGASYVFNSQQSIYGQCDDFWEGLMKYIMRDEHNLVLKKAALLTPSGKVVHRIGHFKPKMTDIEEMKMAFDGEVPEMVRVQGITYCTKYDLSDGKSQLVAFNGNRYLIVARTEQMYVMAVCRSRGMSNAAAMWIKSVASKLRKRHL